MDENRILNNFHSSQVLFVRVFDFEIYFSAVLLSGAVKEAWLFERKKQIQSFP